MKNTKGFPRFVLGAVAAAMVLVSAVILVHACTDGATTTEVSFTKAWPSCDQDLIRQLWQGWGVTDDSWNPAGISDDCNEGLPFAKVMNAIALIGGSPTVAGIFHQRGDYMLESRAVSTPYHDDVYLRFIQDHGAGVEAQSDAGDHTDLDCPIFNFPGVPTPSPGNPNAEMLAERSAVLIHEMWHHWQDAHDYDSSHMDGPQGSCTAAAGACDWFYPHAPGSSLPDGTNSDQIGSLNKTNVVNDIGLYFHSPYQIMTEFESDVAIFGSPVFMPFAIRQEAQNVGNVHLSSNFVNGAGFTIGNPVPFP
ncbi:MAG TPA: hypothetical protein VMS18_19790 [Candidatus Binatia bacterium]|nr:hypothetical protein [Candidatus Binatia bacterium]